MLKVRKKIRVMIVTGSMKRGGAERVISIISNYYVSLGWDVCIVRCLFPEIEYELDSRVRTLDISQPSTNQMLDTPRMIFSLRSIIKREQPDAVLSFMLTINFITAIACKGLNIHFFPSERNDPSVRSLFWQKAGGWAYANSTLTVMQTEKAKNFFSRKIQEKSIVIPNPISVQEYASKYKEKIIVTVGRLEKQKNQKILIEAFAKFHITHPNYRLQIFGRGSLENELREQAKVLGIENNVDFKGNVVDIHHQIKKAALFVLCSNFEGLSNALIEAMMMGLPCISTDCYGSDEIIDNGESGIIVKCGDASELKEAMCKIIDNKELAERYAVEACKRIKIKFNVKVVCEMWEKLVLSSRLNTCKFI